MSFVLVCWQKSVELGDQQIMNPMTTAFSVNIIYVMILVTLMILITKVVSMKDIHVFDVLPSPQVPDVLYA